MPELDEFYWRNALKKVAISVNERSGHPVGDLSWIDDLAEDCARKHVEAHETIDVFMQNHPGLDDPNSFLP